MTENEKLIGKLVNCRVNGTDYIGIVEQISKDQYITLKKCNIWESVKLYILRSNVTKRINMDGVSVLIIYEGFKEVKSDHC